MKKFISALSSLVIAATAMGGALAFSSDAATVDSTIVAFRSNGESAVTAKPGDVVPVAMYIPQSAGFNTLSLKMAINGDATLGQGTVYDMDKKAYPNYAGSFGNYGITISDITWPAGDNKNDPGPLDSGILGAKMFAGNLKAGTYMFTDYAYNFMYQAKHAVQYTAAKYGLTEGSKDIDSYEAWAAAGKPAYDDYTPVFTWAKTESWAYDHAIVTFNLNLPADLADGTYEFDVYHKEYMLTTPSALFDSETNKELPESERTYATSGATGIGGANKLASEKLTITVGDAKPVEATTTAPTQGDKTTTTAKPDAPVPTGDAIVYNLIPDGKDYTAATTANGNNVYNAKPGEDITVAWTVKNDQKVSGLQMFFDFSAITENGGKYNGSEMSDAYELIPTINEKNASITKAENAKDGGQVFYGFGGNEEFQAEDDAVIYYFNITAPTKNGTYSIVKDSRDKCKVIPLVGDQYDFVLNGLDIVVGDTQEETTTAAEPEKQTTTTVTTTVPQQTTTAPAGDGDVLYGDVNCDTQVRINDVVLLNRYLAKTADISAQGKKNADCVKDNNITSDDSTAIKEYLARLIPSLPKK